MGGVIMLLSSVLINALHFEKLRSVQRVVPEDDIVIVRCLRPGGARGLILLGRRFRSRLPSIAIAAQAMRDHARFVARMVAIRWFLIVAALHLYDLHVLHLSDRAGGGGGTALCGHVVLIFPWLGAYVAGWLTRELGVCLNAATTGAPPTRMAAPMNAPEITDSAPVLAARELSAHREACALECVLLEIAAGEFCVLRGAAGSGRTLLLRLLGLLERPDSGEVIVEGAATSQLDEAARDKLRTNASGLFSLLRFFSPR
jgi:ABC-type transport system involved in cytochrome bd biosynthesis fused ATPase/permease subunit